MANLNRIVLLDTGGEELFSGQSMLSSPPPPKPRKDDAPISVEPETLPEPKNSGGCGDHHDHDDEPCPETLRSSVFARAREASFVARTETEVTLESDHRAA